MDSVQNRFLRYVKIDTQSAEGSDTVPSTLKQLDLARLLANECRDLGLRDVLLDEFGTVTATVPPTVTHGCPAIAWVAHVDTSPETSGANVRPILHRDYAGGDLTLPGDPDQVLRFAENPALARLIGGTLITTDGTTLLGADDKAGVAVIMAAAEHLLSHPEVPHGPVRLYFTCDEEIGHGVDHLDLGRLAAVCAYTLDGEGEGKIDCETFSADQAVVTVTGVNIHPAVAKGKMVSALRILSEFIHALPQDHLCPETTDDREGFLHPYSMRGDVGKASARIILRDFETAQLAVYARMLEDIAAPLRRRHPKARIDIEIVEQYRNMREGLQREPRAVPKAMEAMRAAGLEPELTIVRGGTDGSRLTALGLPTPNLSTGEHNPHSPLEWTSVEELERAVQVLVELARAWSTERA